METYPEIADHLNTYANNYVNSKGFRFGSGAAQYIRSMAQHAAQNILNPPHEHLGTSMNRLTEIAEQKLTQFIDQMILARPKVYNEMELKEPIVGERTFAWAKNIICPMWPIC